MSHFRISLVFAVVAAMTFGLHAQETSVGELSSELPRIAPTSPDEAQQSFEVANGFQMELVASEPLITSPVAIEWDAKGRLFVCEMRGYSEDRDKGLSRITMLEDVDHDGTLDTSVIFADGLLWPTALFPFDGGLFVGDAPNIYYMKDNDGDGKADQKDTILTGFGVSNVQGLLNSFRWGFDNRIHVACSSSAGNVRRPDDPETSAENIRGRDLAFNPRTFEFELTSGAAQHGMCFDDWGRKFVSSNSDHIQQVMYEDRYAARNKWFSPPGSRISIAEDGPQAEVFRISPVEPWRIVRTRLRVNGLVPGPVEGGGRAAGYFTGATGVTIYRGDAWPKEHKGMAIIGDVGSNLIHRKKLNRNDQNQLVYSATRVDPDSELVRSKDIWFRPAQFANAPDGSLWVIDVCREVIEHPKSLPHEIKRHLDLTSGRDRGRLYRIIPTGFEHRATPHIRDMAVEQLVTLLGHPNAWHRETAARVLHERDDRAAIPILEEFCDESESTVGRLHAMYCLHALGVRDESLLRKRLADTSPEIRMHAIRLAEDYPICNDLCDSLGKLLRDPAIDVRYQLAFTLGSIDWEQRVDSIVELVRQDVDQPWMCAAVQSSLSNDAGKAFAVLVRDPNLHSQAASAFLAKLAKQIVAKDDPIDLAFALEVVPLLEEQNSAFALPILGELLRGRLRAESELSKLDKQGRLTEADAILQSLIQRCINDVSDDSITVPERVQAIESLSFGSFAQVEKTLAHMIDSREPNQIQSSAMKTLGRFRSPAVVKPILRAWSRLSPQQRGVASEVLFSRSDRALALLDAIDAGEIAVADVERSRLTIAAKSKNQTVKSRAALLLKSTSSKSRQKVVEAYSKVLSMDGDLDRGRTLFRKHCGVCHKMEGIGHEIGPNLAAMKTRGAETILVNVLDPNREVNPQYLNYVLLTTDGRTLTGMIGAESATSLTLRRAENASDTVLRQDIEQLKSTGLSIMPEGMEEVLTPQAMADVIRYLMKTK